MSHEEKIAEFEKTRQLLFAKYMEVADLAERIGDEAYQLTCEIEKINHLIALEQAAASRETRPS